MKDKELIRSTVLEYLAQRPTAAYEAKQIARMINMRGMLDSDVLTDDVEEALTFLEGLGYVSSVFGGLGSSKHFRVTSAGTLFHERGE